METDGFDFLYLINVCSELKFGMIKVHRVIFLMLLPNDEKMGTNLFGSDIIGSVSLVSTQFKSVIISI